MGYRVINGSLYPIGNFQSINTESEKEKKILHEKADKSFENVLKEQINKKEGFTISNHAAERLRGISFNALDMQKINEGINRAEEKGAKNSLILYKDVALVTSIENRTVITAVQGERRKENVFTNIDSVVLI